MVNMVITLLMNSCVNFLDLHYVLNIIHGTELLTKSGNDQITFGNNFILLFC